MTDLFPDDSGAEFSPCRTWRYRLWRIWDRTLPMLGWCLCNPSDADENHPDPTVRRLGQFSLSLGYGGFYLVNMFAYVASDPDAMDASMLRGVDIVGVRNDAAIVQLGKDVDLVVAAWGLVGGRYKERVAQIRYLLPDKLMCLRQTKGGHPEHPLYIPGTETLKPWPLP